MMTARDTAPMPGLAALLADVLEVPRELDVAVSGLAHDSRAVAEGHVFFARRGATVDGERFADAARAAGAAAVVRTGPAAVRRHASGGVEARVEDVDLALGLAAARWHGSPATHLQVLGVTGTNGKTSVCHLLAGALADQPRGACGLIGTLGHGLPGALGDPGLTTPDALELQRQLASLRDAGCATVAMEVSSHALDQRRVAGLGFHAAVFTNLTQDHLDYHGDMARYGAAKARLFDSPGLALAVVNADDRFGITLLERVAPSTRTIAYGLGAAPDGVEHVRGRLRAATGAGLVIDVDSPWGAGVLEAPLAGRFNASNLLATLATLLGLGVELEVALARLARARAVPGRMEPFGGEGAKPLVVVDFAHTPDALEKALETLREHCRGRLWCVFGCGGDRDPGKRAPMGACAARLADQLVITDDNPRGEDGDVIVQHILAGVAPGTPVEVVRDRGAAIGRAVGAAAAGDVVLVAGKGHERTQESAGVRRPFNDAAAVRAALAEGLA